MVNRAKAQRYYHQLKKGILEGYTTINVRTEDRRKKLLDVAKHQSLLKVIRELNLVRNYQKHNPEAQRKMSQDLEFLEACYKKARK